MADAQFRDLCLDASDPRALATFWATALGDGGSTRMWVDPVPEAREAKTRVHLDVRLGEPDPSTLLAAGASVVREPGATLQRAPDGEIEWWILTDPEGNEFCAFAPGDD